MSRGKRAMRMKICVIGAGAIGGWIAARLSRAGVHRVSVLARGDTLAALRAHGVELIEHDAHFSATVVASDDTQALGE
ncbi:MAG: ketopantoate reductase family protein, partial [Casimicrobium sp.]